MTRDIHTQRLSATQGDGSNRTVFAVSVGSIALLFLMAVSIAGWTVNTAYQSAHWQKREQAALTRQKELQEVLSSSRSLQTALSFAEQEGFVIGTTVASLDTAQSVAQNVVVR